MSDTETVFRPTKRKILVSILFTVVVLMSLVTLSSSANQNDIKMPNTQQNDSFIIEKISSTPDESITEYIISEASTLINLNEIIINVDGEKRVVESAAETISNLLAEQNIVLDDDDEVLPTAETIISDNLTIDILHIEYITREIEEEIPFTTEKVNSSALRKGTQKVAQKGSTGIKTIVYKDKVINGVVESSEMINEEITKEPVKEIIKIGVLVEKAITRFGNNKIEKNGDPISEIKIPAEVLIGENNVPAEYKYKITGRAAAYCEPGGKTATGKPVMPGRVAVDPRKIPYGTEMWIVSNDGVVYGYAIAEDTGGFIYNNYYTVDLYMNSESQCRKWGDRGVTIYVL